MKITRFSTTTSKKLSSELLQYVHLLLSKENFQLCKALLCYRGRVPLFFFSLFNIPFLELDFVTAQSDLAHRNSRIPIVNSCDSFSAYYAKYFFRHDFPKKFGYWKAWGLHTSIQKKINTNMKNLRFAW